MTSPRTSTGCAGALALAVVGCLGSPPESLRSDAGAAPDAPAVEGDVAPGGGCGEVPPLAPFVDDFSTDALAWAVEPKPNRSGAGAIEMAVTGEELVFTPRSAGGDYAWLQTVPFDFSSARIAVRVSQLTTDGSSQPYLGIIGPAGEEMMFRFNGTRLSVPGGISLLYLPTVQVWWQIASEGGTFRYQTSEDGVTWSDVNEVAAGFDVGAVQFEVGVNVDSAGPADRGVFAVDDLDLPPCAG